MSDRHVFVMKRNTGQMVVMLGPFDPDVADDIGAWLQRALDEKRAINLICGPGREGVEEGEPRNPIDGGSRFMLDGKVGEDGLDDELADSGNQVIEPDDG